MDLYTEYGLVITDSENFEECKSIIDKLGKQVKDSFSKTDTMHMFQFPGLFTLYFTCHVKDGFVRFGIYDSRTKTLSRTASPMLIQKINNSAIDSLLTQLEFAAKREIPLSPLEALWRLSIEKEKSFTDKNDITCLYDPHLLDVSVEQLQSEAEKTIRL